MLESFVMEIDQIKFGGQIGSFCFPNKQKLKNSMKSEWHASVKFYRPLGFDINRSWMLKQPILRNNRARFTLQYKGLQRTVFVAGKITIKKFKSIYEFNQKSFQRIFEAGENSFHIDIELWQTIDTSEIPDSIEIAGELNFRVSPENYFFFKFEESHLPMESDIKDCQLQIVSELSKDLQTLYEKEDFADIVMRCGKDDFKAHKVILCSRSAVFAKMLSTQMKENKENLINMDNMTPTALKIMLRYVYCGVVHDLDDSTVSELLSAAEQYQLSGLKNTCLYFLQSNLSVDNALCTLAYADLHDSKLKNKTIEFICKEYDNLRTTEEWGKFHKERPDLENEILHSIIDFAKLGSQCVLKSKPSVSFSLKNEHS